MRGGVKAIPGMNAVQVECLENAIELTAAGIPTTAESH
jgi:hypothetical protein